MNMKESLLLAFNELLFVVGELALQEGEAWRLAHPELMDAYQAVMEQIGGENES